MHIIFDFVAFNSSGNDFHSFTNIYPQGNGFMQLGLVSIASQLLLSDSLLFRFKTKNELILEICKVGHSNKKRLPRGKLDYFA